MLTTKQCSPHGHDVIIDILGERISDRKFLALIKQLHKSGIMEGNISLDTTLGIPQGGIASPILFNIYMHKFDEFVNNSIAQVTAKENASRDSGLLFKRPELILDWIESSETLSLEMILYLEKPGKDPDEAKSKSKQFLR